ncbi:MAG: hypothetical protein BWK80_20335 [Desulfobacteraceae bacterium IS3]|nr:MAG: hypothetical protein BWK80_20335 [Desulfobacteraceae bacterium IS3]
MTKQKIFFRAEQEMLEHARTVLDDEQYRHNHLMPEFASLLESYEKMYRQFRSLIKISDHQQNRLNELNKQLAASNASKDKFFSIISHDLRGPLGAMISLAELLQEQIESEAYKKEVAAKFAEQVCSSAKTLYALLENLLAWSRIQRGVMELYPEHLEIQDIVKFNLGLFASQTERKNIRLKSAVISGTSVYADYNAVNTVFRNIISNAIKFTPRGGKIEITARSYTETVLEIAVSDTGIGISQESISKLFQPGAGFTASKPGTDGEQGTGLGMVLCKELLDKNGGDIRIESSPGAGTTVRVTLPGSVPHEKLYSDPGASGTGEEIYEDHKQIQDIVISDKAKTHLTEIIDKLENKFLPEWDKFNNVFFLDDIKVFASELKEFASEYHLDFLADYSQKLDESSQEINILAIEKYINYFPELISKIIEIANAEMQRGREQI